MQYVYNATGDVVMLLDDRGFVLAEYTYDAWGNITVTGDAALAKQNPFTYRGAYGYYYDWETGLYYLQSRYYDPATCRFINADGQLNEGVLGSNAFAYCENNAVMAMDPDGRKILIMGKNMQLLNLLKMITCDSLKFDDGGFVVISQRVSNPKRYYGTTLIRLLISNAKYVWINPSNSSHPNMSSRTLFIGGLAVYNKAKKRWVCGAGSPSVIFVNSSQSNAISPAFIRVAHELIHVYRSFLGCNMQNDFIAKYNCSAEEVLTCGLVFSFGSAYANVRIFVDENKIRHENGLVKRTYYNK